MQNFLTELKRRKVFRVAIGYAAGAWGVLQIADIVFPLMNLPEWSMRLVLFVSAAGFPVAMILAWAFDMTSQGLVLTEEAPEPVRTPKMSPAQIAQLGLITVLVITVGYLYYDKLYPRPSSQQQTAQDNADTQGAALQSIAVLPFENMSTDEENRYFSDGISEELLNVLANVSGLRVAARTSSFYFRDSNEDVITIGRKLGVATLLEGSVRKDNANNVRITAQLIDTSNGYHLWSKTYKGTLNDIFTLQDDIARQVVMAIIPMILENGVIPTGPSTSNVAAYNEYLLGRALLRQPREDKTLAEARAKFNNAIKLDPDYAEAYAGLCDTLLAYYTHHREAESFALAEQACHRALTRADSETYNWDVRVALGVLYREAGEYQKSLDSLDLAHRTRPESVRALTELGLTYSAAGQTEEAERVLQQALALDENNWNSHLVLANYYSGIGRYTPAIEEYDTALAILPDSTSSLIGKGSALYMLGQEAPAEAIWLQARELALEKDSGSLGIIYSNLGLLYYYRADYLSAVEMHEAAAQTIGDDHRVWGRIAESYRALGEHEKERKAYDVAIPLAEEELTRNPNNWETLGLLGIYYGFSGQREQALNYLDRMLGQANNLSTAHYFAALIYWSQGNSEAAYDQLDDATARGFSGRMLAEDPDLQRLGQLDSERFEAIVTKGSN